MSVWKVQYRVEESLYSSETKDWFCTVDDSDYRCLRVTNKCGLTLPHVEDEIGFTKIDTGVRVAVPKGYAVLVAQLRPSKVRRGACEALPCVANGVVDSGYRGSVKIIIYYNALTSVIPRGCMTIRLAIVRLSEIRPDTRMLFYLYDAGHDYECGMEFVHSVRKAAESGAGDAEPQLPPDGSELWKGTGCSALTCLYDCGVRCATHYHTTDENISFVVLGNGAAVLGLKELPQEQDGPTTVSFFSSGEFATLLPFHSTFLEKRDEDAGYDIPSPVSTTLKPMTTTSFVVRQRYICGDGSVIPCVFGRSSMNASGLVVLPSRWRANEWLTIRITNMSDRCIKIDEGQKIAQLLLVSRDAPLWLPRITNMRNQFPAPVDVRLDRENFCQVPRWREAFDFDLEAPASLRCDEGFGSTGK
ncbi:deoxyuridine triphosphatase [Falconid herpesvirus 1]|uniref:Deoxyuridine triphosphatase n=2 Tax=Columbid alphaherpesvirus 1 TaxID=93386 RepID=A0A068ER51_9ALPH|nr:deoxyuridine triphosphatase [Falconid herpesvirus 1]YP_009352961.1 deoxyuridine triphosphatase [Columbid alphaherpesvirus 1]AID52757.1 deoxyuridine triphosphatase [Falconid herpesvirus 1]ARD71378.1 deoxyuridine triphosphatase [Columbid alphaherpesvirus 1]